MSIQPVTKHQIWRVAHFTAHDGVLLTWHASERLADQEIRMIKDRGPDAVVSKALVQIPQSRKGLVSWLNAHLACDNG